MCEKGELWPLREGGTEEHFWDKGQCSAPPGRDGEGLGGEITGRWCEESAPWVGKEAGLSLGQQEMQRENQGLPGSPLLGRGFRN